MIESALEHPAPWRWDGEDFGDLTLRDATGDWVADGGANGVGVAVSSEYAKCLIAAAPEMAHLLREIITRLDQRPGGDLDRDTCPLCLKFHYHDKDCPYELAGGVLTRIDAAMAP